MSRRTSRSKPLPVPSESGSEDLSGGGGAKHSSGGGAKRSSGGSAKRSSDSAAKSSPDSGSKRSLDSAAKASLDRNAAKSSLDGGAKRSLDSAAKSSPDSGSKSSLSGAAKASPDSNPKRAGSGAAKASPDSNPKRAGSGAAKPSPNSGSKPASSAFESYNSHLFTSSCCHQFNIHEGPMCICSQCKRLITQLKDDEVLTVSVKFNNSLESNVSADIQNSFKLKAKRFATDPTYELCGRKCPKCKSLCRYTRDAQMNILFICSNSSCRYVFNDE